MNDQDLFGPTVYTYTRKQAIEDGLQFKLSAEQADIARKAGWKYPVYLTGGIWNLIERSVAAEHHGNDFNGVLFDILWMARFGHDLSVDIRKFNVIIPGAVPKREHRLYLQIGPADIDDPSPAITIMLPGEV